MQRRTNQHEKIYQICLAGLIAALYTVLTVVIGAFGLSGGAVQIRISEALCVLPFFTPAAIPGLFVGCLLSNLLTGCLWQDVIFGSLATLLGSVGAWLLRKYPALVPLPTVAANLAVIPPILAYAYGMEQGLPFLFASVGMGEVLSAYVLGLALLYTLKKTNFASRMR